MRDECSELARFTRGDLDPGNFPHREHIRMGFEMRRRHNFAETACHYSFALRTITAKAGRPEAFHQSMTIAFLSLIAERMQSGGIADFLFFAQANPDRMDKSALARWYGPERLTMDAARRPFLLPDPVR